MSALVGQVHTRRADFSCEAVQMTRSHPEHNYPCDCAGLDISVDESNTPIVFDAQTNEYHLVYGDENQGIMVFYYCPFCGGRLPDSRRHRLFARITQAEATRLRTLIEGIRTIEDACRILGEPDTDLAQGETHMTPESASEPTQVDSYRTIRYSKLSDTAVVEFTDYRKDRVGVRFTAKPLEEGQIEDATVAPIRTKESPALRDREHGRPTVFCSFCGTSVHGTRKILQSDSAAICSECAETFTRDP